MSTLHDFGFVAFDLKYTRPDDTGTYTCKASNSIGEAVISANLKVSFCNENKIDYKSTFHFDMKIPNSFFETS